MTSPSLTQIFQSWQTSVQRAPAEAHVESCPALAYCRDICNGSKHAQLEAKNVTTKMERTTTGEDEFGPIEQPQLFVHWRGQFLEAEKFAAECIREWNHFLEAQGLLTQHVDTRGPKGEVTT